MQDSDQSVLAALAGLPPLREVIGGLGLRARKSLGQNFLTDLNLTAKIAGLPGDLRTGPVLEVGPGPGALTRALLAAGARQLTVIEKDPRCLPALEEIRACCPERLRIIEADALKIDEKELFRDTGPVKVVANLPYNIATPLMAKWLEADPWPPWFASLTLMFQREVAERIVAAPGGKAYGRLSVFVQWRTRPRIVLNLPPAAFVPRPKVTSSVVHFEVLPRPVAPASPVVLSRIVAAAFGQRRKMLRASLRPLGGDSERLLEAAGIDPRLRAEDLEVTDFCALARIYEEEKIIK